MNRRDFGRLVIGTTVPTLLVAQSEPALSSREDKGKQRVTVPQADDVVELLRWMVRIETQNPPPDGRTWRETELQRALAELLQRHGIVARIFENTPGRSNLVARLRGNGSQKPLLLTTHIDVVGADLKEWKHPPFSAAVDGDLIYGRGTLDNKGMAAALVWVFLRLARERVPLARDVILCLVADEESGGIQGMKFLTENRWDEIASEVALAEGDPPLLRGERVEYIPIQCGEKKSFVVRLRARGTAGHASTPLEDNPILTLARALIHLGPYSTQLHITPLAREYLRRMASSEPPEVAQALLEVASRGEFASPEGLDRVMRANPVYNAVLRATVCPTIVQAGTRANVIPAEAECTVNCRLLPDQPIENVVAELRRLIASDRVQVDVVPRVSADGPATPHDTPFFRVFEDVSSALWPGIATVPYLAPAASDARYLRSRGTLVYGVFPFPATTEEFMTIHAPDERIRISSLRQGVNWLNQAVRRIAAV